MVSIPRHEFDTVLLRAQVELLQRVNRLITLLEEKDGECKTGESNQEPTVVETPKRV